MRVWPDKDSFRILRRLFEASSKEESPASKAVSSEGRRPYPLGHVEDLNDARTTLADFFSILLKACPAPHSISLTSGYEKAQHGFYYPYDTEVYCDPLLVSPNPARQNRSSRELRPLGGLRHEGVVVCATVPAIGTTSRVLTSLKWRLR